MALAFVAYFPAARMVGRAEPLGFPSAIAWATPLVAMASVLVAKVVWSLAVRHHQSTGS